eukprot:scaffold20.g7610.t1
MRERTEGEDTLLLQLAADPACQHKNGWHNWKLIAPALGRTSAGQQPRKRWTTAEVQELEQLGSSSEHRLEVVGSSELNWAMIGEHFRVSGDAAHIEYHRIKCGGGATGETATRSADETGNYLELELAVQALLLLSGAPPERAADD